MSSKRAFCFLIFFVSLSTLSLSAQTLYGSGIPVESALVRCIILTETNRNTLLLGGVSIPLDDLGEITPYYPVGSGMYFLSVGGDELEMVAQSGAYYTLIFSGSEIRLFEDTAHNDPVRSQLYLYNLSEAPCTLVADGASVVFGNLPGGDSQQILLNPLDIGFTLSAEGKECHWDSLPLARGESVSILLYDGGILMGKAQVRTLK
jgi:hypothetical protein